MSNQSLKICPYCQTSITNLEDACVCAKCGIPHHRDCWQENRGCTTFGCDSMTARYYGDSQLTVGQTPPSIGYSPVAAQTIQVPEVSETPPAGVFCSSCGSQNPGDSRFCNRCGYPIAMTGGSTTTQPQYNPQPLYTQSYPPNYYELRQNEYGVFRGYAGFWLRFVAIIIDGLILMPVNFLITSMFGKYSIMWILASWLYFSIFESSKLRATPGKLALGLTVTDMDGSQIGFGKATGRHFGKIVSGLILFIGYMMAGWTERKQGLHDMMANCLVVNKG